MLEQFEVAAKAVADPSRVRILKLLAWGELCVCQITAVLDLAPATISKHLAVLRVAGMLRQRRDGKWIYYRLSERSLNPYAPEFLRLLASLPEDEPTVAEDRRLLDVVRRMPLRVLCDQGRPALASTRGARDHQSSGTKECP